MFIKFLKTHDVYQEEAGLDGGSAGGAPAPESVPTPEPSPKVSELEASLLKEVMQKKQQIKDSKAEIEALREQIKRYDGIDVEQVKALLKAREDEEKKQLEQKGEWDNLKARIKQEHTEEMAKVSQRIAELESALGERTSMIENLTVGQSFEGSEFIRSELTLTPSKARIIYGAFFDVENGTVVGYDKPRGMANRTQLVDGKGDPLGFSDALKRIVDADPDRDALIRSKAKAGAGSRPEPVAKPPVVKDDRRGVDRIGVGLASISSGRK